MIMKDTIDVQHASLEAFFDILVVQKPRWKVGNHQHMPQTMPTQERRRIGCYAKDIKGFPLCLWALFQLNRHERFQLACRNRLPRPQSRISFKVDGHDTSTC